MNRDFWGDKKVLVTGATGFKGAWLVEVLNYLGAKTLGLGLSQVSDPSLFALLNHEERFETIFQDICTEKPLLSVVDQFEPDVVMHLAAESLVLRSFEKPIQTFFVNVIGTVNVLQDLRSLNSVKSFVHVSSDKTYAPRPFSGQGFTENSELGGLDPYSSSKSCADLAFQSMATSYSLFKKMGLATVRAGNVIGGGDWSQDRLIPDYMRALQSGNTMNIRHPDHVRPWQHVLDCLKGYLLVAESQFNVSSESIGIWNVGPPKDEKGYSVAELLASLEDRFSEPANIDYQVSDKIETSLLYLDSSKIREKLGYRSTLTSKEAVDWTVDWYSEYLAHSDICIATRTQIDKYLKGLTP